MQLHKVSGAVGNSYKYLIVNWGGHIAHAAFAIEQKNRAEEVFGPLATFLGFHPFKLESFPAPYGKKPKYEESYYWKEYTSLPQFDDFAKSGSVFKIFIKVRAVSTTLRVLAIAGLIALPGFSRRRFFLSIKNQKVRKLTLGAQIASDFLRNGEICNGRLEIGRDLIRVLYECYLVAHYWLDVAPQIDFRQLLFSNPETTYRNEIARRALLRRGASEIFSDRWAEGRFTLATSHRFGSELSLCRPVSQSPVEIESARKDLLGRLSGNSRYIYMGTEDVDSRRVVQVVDARRARRDVPRTKAVVFLHCVSDAQFLCGEDDCFADLDDWLNCSLNILLAKGYDVYVKAHPAMFSDYNRRQYPIDGRYAEYLATEKGLDWSGLADGQIARSRDPRIWVVDTKLAIASLKQALGDFVAITHHGTVATEAVGLRIPVVWSNANPARQFPEFGFSYKTVKEYSRLLNLFRQGGLVIDQQRFENCLRYLAASKNDYSVTVWTGFSRLAGQNIFADPDIYDNLVLSADPQRRPRLYAEIQELYGVGSIPSVALWKGEGGSEECRQADINPARRASVPLRT